MPAYVEKKKICAQHKRLLLHLLRHSCCATECVHLSVNKNVCPYEKSIKCLTFVLSWLTKWSLHAFIKNCRCRKYTYKTVDAQGLITKIKYQQWKIQAFQCKIAKTVSGTKVSTAQLENYYYYSYGKLRLKEDKQKKTCFKIIYYFIYISLWDKLTVLYYMLAVSSHLASVPILLLITFHS